MARSEARIYTRIWQDRDFVSLPALAQRMYLIALSQPGLSYCGVVSYTPKRWAAFASDTTVKAVRHAVQGLIAGRFVEIDEQTEELWVRSFLKHNAPLFKNHNLVVALARDFDTIASDPIRKGVGNGVAKGVAKGFPNGLPDGVRNRVPDGFLNVVANGVPNPVGNGVLAPASRARSITNSNSISSSISNDGVAKGVGGVPPSLEEDEQDSKIDNDAPTGDPTAPRLEDDFESEKPQVNGNGHHPPQQETPAQKWDWQLEVEYAPDGSMTIDMPPKPPKPPAQGTDELNEFGWRTGLTASSHGVDAVIAEVIRCLARQDLDGQRRAGMVIHSEPAYLRSVELSRRVNHEAELREVLPDRNNVNQRVGSIVINLGGDDPDDPDGSKAHAESLRAQFESREAERLRRIKLDAEWADPAVQADYAHGRELLKRRLAGDMSVCAEIIERSELAHAEQMRELAELRKQAERRILNPFEKEELEKLTTLEESAAREQSERHVGVS